MGGRRRCRFRGCTGGSNRSAASSEGGRFATGLSLSDPAPASALTGPRRRRVPRSIKRVIGLLVAFALLEYIVVPKLTAERGHLDLLAHINLGYVAAGLALEAGSLLAYALLTRAIIEQFRPPPRLLRLMQIDMSTLALTRVLPGGSAAGTGLGYRLLTATGLDKTETGLTLAVQSIGSAVILNSLLWVGLVLSIPYRALTNSPGSTSAIPKVFYGVAAALGVALFGFFATVVLSLTRGEKKSLAVVRAVAHRVRFLNEESVVSLVERVSDQLRLMGTHRRLLIRAIFWGAANWLLDAAGLWVMLAAFGYHLGPDALLISYSLANIVAVIPLTPGGVGVVEAVLITALAAFGATKGVAALGVIAYRLVSFWLPIPLGGLAYLTLRLDPTFRERPGAERGPVAEA